ncbi:MAG: winged helix-turn-helix domain-containing protein [Acidobacteria bacterium]|nr:winged helix-turn-helix domain-containing protein [Acidobacteriota bacterium]
MSHQPKVIYEFSHYRLDAAERLLLRNGEAVPLQPKVFDLLCVLVEQHGHLLEKDELMKLVWPDAVVEEANLANNVSILRKTLSEDGERFIETVPKRGYRFVAPVGKQERLMVSEAKPPVPPDTKSTKRRPALAILLMVLLLAGIAGVVIFWRSQRRPDAPDATIKSIAVLPLRAVQPNERDESLEIGATSILITRLGSLRQLVVRPENAVEQYARPGQDPLAAGREQKVDAVLDSRYQRSGDRFRFTMRLLRVTDGTTVWGDTFDQKADDLFAIEDALSDKAATALRLTLTGAEKELLAKRYTSSPEAYLLYAKGRYLLHQRRKPDTEKANDYFQRAIALDPSFALAYAILGHSYASLAWDFPDQEFRLKAMAAHDQALKLDGQLAEAHSYLACYKQTTEWDYNAAEQHHQRALELNPNSADVRLEHAVYLAMLGRFEQAIPEIKKAEELDPTDQWISRLVALVLFYAGCYDETIEQVRKAIDLNNRAGDYGWMIRAYRMKGDEQNAFAAALKQAEVRGTKPEEIADMKAAFATEGWKGILRNRLNRKLEQEKREYVPQWEIAMHYAQLGEKEQALARLQKAVEDRNFFVVSLKVEPAWDAYRTDPRFKALVRRVGLAP